MKQVTSVREFNEEISKSSTTVALFKTTWCGDCHYLDVFMPEVEQLYKDRLNMIHVDRDDLAEVGEEYNVLGIPSFIVFHEGKELIRFVNKLRKTREEVVQFLDRAVEVSNTMAK